jgi:hypothetical protein
LRSFLTQRQIGHTPFLWACWQANDEFIAQLADVGNADINTQDQVASWPPCPLPLTFITGWQYGTSFGLPSRGRHARGSFIESKCSMESQKLCKRGPPLLILSSHSHLSHPRTGNRQSFWQKKRKETNANFCFKTT